MNSLAVGASTSAPSRPHLPTVSEVGAQAYRDLFGKDVQETPTVSYVWMADQLGHFGLGFQITFLLRWIAEALGYLSGWAVFLVAIGNLSIWVVKEWFDYLREVRKAKTASSIFPFNAKEIRWNIVTALFFIAAGVIVAAISRRNPLDPIIALGVLLVPALWVIVWWLRRKITFQQAGLPYLYRLTNFPNKIADDEAEAQRLATFIIDLANPASASGQGKHLVIAGPLGSGTSSLAAGVGTEFAFAMGIGRYTTLVKLLESSVMNEGKSLGQPEFQDGRILWPWQFAELLIIDDLPEVGSITARIASLTDRRGAPIEASRAVAGDSLNQLEPALEQARLDRAFLTGLGCRRSVWVIGDVKTPTVWRDTLAKVLGLKDPNDIALVSMSQTMSEALQSKAPDPNFTPKPRERAMIGRNSK
jgi:hypothetical protein